MHFIKCVFQALIHYSICIHIIYESDSHFVLFTFEIESKLTIIIDSNSASLSVFTNSISCDNLQSICTEGTNFIFIKDIFFNVQIIIISKIFSDGRQCRIKALTQQWIQTQRCHFVPGCNVMGNTLNPRESQCVLPFKGYKSKFLTQISEGLM